MDSTDIRREELTRLEALNEISAEEADELATLRDADDPDLLCEACGLPPVDGVTYTCPVHAGWVIICAECYALNLRDNESR